MLEIGQSNWYAVQTRSKFERFLASELKAKGIESFCPEISEVRQWADRKKTVMEPVFKGYLFARFPDVAEMRVRVLQTTGAVRILGAQNSIEPIPDKEIDGIRRAVHIYPCFRHPELREGAWVRVKRGALKNVEGVLVRFKNRARLVISISILSQSIATEIDIGDVEVVRPAAMGIPVQPVNQFA